MDVAICDGGKLRAKSRHQVISHHWFFSTTLHLEPFWMSQRLYEVLLLLQYLSDCRIITTYNVAGFDVDCFSRELKEAHAYVFKHPPKDLENSIMECLASATKVSIMIPMDAIKTRLVTQASNGWQSFGALQRYCGLCHLNCPRRLHVLVGVSAFVSGHNDG